MAEKKQSRQTKASAAASRKSLPSKKGKKQESAANRAVEQAELEQYSFPLRFLFAIIAIAFFLVGVMILIGEDGVILHFFRNLMEGLFGVAGFILLNLASLYIFMILAFSGKRPVLLRCVSTLVSVFLCGCIAHLITSANVLPSGFALVTALYKGGYGGTTGGVLCGLTAMLLESLFGTVLSCILLILAAVIFLLAAMQITIPSIIRAIQNRPRLDPPEETPEEEVQEPAALVVNHLANKHIERVERKRRLREEARAYEEMTAVATGEPPAELPLTPQIPTKRKKPRPVEDSRPLTEEERRVRDMMRQIENDPGLEVAAATVPVEAEEDDIDLPVRFPDPIPVPVETIQETVIPLEMPPLEPISEPVFTPEPAEIPPSSAVEPVPAPVQEKVTAKDAAVSAAEVAAEIAKADEAPKPVYCFPPIDLLKKPKNGASDGTNEMRDNSRRLSETLESFHIDAHIINVTRGPSVTRYDVELAKGVRLNKLTAVADDLALNLGAASVRIAAVPGQISVVGIEVPNQSVTMVSLREVIDSKPFESAVSKSSFAVGKDISGNCIVGNIAKLPHMLIAGTTGSGKSVCMNSIIISLLYKSSPEDVKLIMVDPKMVELGIYNGIPHLLIPVVTDPKKAAGSLQWAVTEMMRRYRSMSDAGVRDLESFNSMIVNQEIDGTKLPQIVVIIDELADLMLVAAKEVEESICRIAQMGRAAGIHLVIATQRPSADVITGLMKANIPSRIAFAVSSAMESRIILDTQGAEKLVGKGDMLFAPIGIGKPVRVQGCFVSDSEVEAVSGYVKNHFAPTYDSEVMDEIEKKAVQTGTKAATAAEPEPNEAELAGDEMLPDAVDVFMETGQASVSMLQRRLKLGYARAARIVDEMEEKGIVGPFMGSKPRAILITKEQWAAMKAGGAQMSFTDLEENEPVPEELP